MTPTASPVAPPSAAEFQFESDNCGEFLVLVPIDAAAARRFVPSEYTVTADATGKAVAFAGLKQCGDLLIDGVSIGAASTSDVGVVIDSPDGSDGNHYYQTWWLTNNPDLAGRLVAQGWRGGLANTTLMATTAGEASFSVDWSEGAYSARGTVAVGSSPPDMTFTGWHDHANGTVAVRKTLSPLLLGSGTGFTTAAGPLADLMGASASGAGIMHLYTITGTVGPRMP